MASIKDLYTREDCETPQKVYIGDEWIACLGMDAQSVRKAQLEANRAVARGELSPEDAMVKIYCAVITDWSFDEPCDEKHIRELNENSPSLLDQVDAKASARANFTKRLRSKSGDTQKATPGSKGRQPKKAK